MSQFQSTWCENGTIKSSNESNAQWGWTGLISALILILILNIAQSIILAYCHSSQFAAYWFLMTTARPLQASPWTWILWQTNTGNIGNEISICQCMVVLGRRETFLIWATKGIYSTLIILTIDGEGLAPGLSIRLEAGIKVTWKNVICFRGHWNIFCCSV